MRGNGPSVVDRAIKETTTAAATARHYMPLLYFSAVLIAGGCSKVPDEKASRTRAVEWGDSGSKEVHGHCLGAAMGR